MKYLMMVRADEIKDFGQLAPVEPWVEEMEARGIRILGDRLTDPADWTTVRVRSGEVVVSDGPYTETKEFSGGFDVIDCADLDEAMEVASKHPVAQFGVIELRPFWPLDL